jgi:hypothetical protein
MSEISASHRQAAGNTLASAGNKLTNRMSKKPLKPTKTTMDVTAVIINFYR